MNLLKETLDVLKENKKSEKDVLWVGSKDGKYSIEFFGFKQIADFDYDNGYGINKIVSDLVIVGKDWWIERGEYDGSEWWEFKTIPTKNNRSKPFNKLLRDITYSDTIHQLNYVKKESI